MGIDNYKLIELQDLKMAEWNYKENDDSLVQKLIKNIQKNGQIENLIVRGIEEGYEVVNGNHRLLALKEMNMDKAVCYDLGDDISEAQAKRIAIETNETKFQVDNVKLAQTFNDLLKDFDVSDLALTMPFTEDQITNFDKLVTFDWDELEKDKVTESELEDITKVTLELPNEHAITFEARLDEFLTEFDYVTKK